MPMTPLPTPPSRDNPGTFATLADAFLGALPLFQTEANALEVAVDADRVAAAASAAAALASENNAASSETNAGLSEDAAAASATSALNAPGTNATSTTSLTVGTGSKSLTIQTGKAYSIGQWVIIANTPTPANYMLGQITAFDSGAGTVTVNVTVTGGSGTFTAWSFALSASAGGVLSVNGETGVVTGFVKETGAQTLSTKQMTSPRYTRDDDGSITGGTWAIDYNNGPLIKATVGAAITTITTSNLPASGTVGHLKLMLVNPGAFAITFPAAWKFIKSDFTTTTFAGLGVTLPASGVSFFDLITDDAGTNVYVTISRN